MLGRNNFYVLEMYLGMIYNKMWVKNDQIEVYNNCFINKCCGMQNYTICHK